MSDKHTPTPWRFGHTADSIVAGDVASDKPGAMYYGGELVAESMNHHDRDFVLRACNSHEQLVAALEDMLEWARAVSDEYIDGGDLRKDYRQSLSEARDALAVARGAA